MSSALSRWGDKVTIVANETANDGRLWKKGEKSKQNYDDNDDDAAQNNERLRCLVLRVTNVAADLTVDQILRDLCSGLNVKSLRVIWRGRNSFVAAANNNGAASFSNAGDGNV